MKEPRVVIDTNIIVSVLKGSSKLSHLYTVFKEGKFKLVINAEAIKELSAVLYRPYLELDPRHIKELFRLIRMKAIRVNLPPPFITACRDPKDNFLLELAVTANATYIITGDEDLLILHPFRGIAILTAKEFLSRLKK